MIIKTFLLLAVLSNPNADSYVIDYGLSADDCSEVTLDVIDAGLFEIAPGLVVDASTINFECVEEAAIPPCEFEDSENCYWNANKRGNGGGDSFIAWNDNIYYMD